MLTLCLVIRSNIDHYNDVYTGEYSFDLVLEEVAKIKNMYYVRKFFGSCYEYWHITGRFCQICQIWMVSHFWSTLYHVILCMIMMCCPKLSLLAFNLIIGR